MKWRACSVQNCKTTEEHACEFRGSLIDYQELLLSVFLFQFFPNSKKEDNTMLTLCKVNVDDVFFAFVSQ